MIWLEINRDEQGKPLTDTQNQDSSKRSRLLRSLEIIWNLVCNDGKWKRNICDLESGNFFLERIFWFFIMRFNFS